ncbi:MAG: SDR family NAD(P)-dependent oxidoreductase, partial [Phocaeicola sp.]
MHSFENEVVVITGATSGIGEATAKLFAESGAIVILVGRNEEKGRQLVASIANGGGNTVFFKCDVSNEKNVKKLAEFVSD